MRKPFKFFAVLFAVLAVAAISIELTLSAKKSVSFIIAAVGYTTYFLIMVFRNRPPSLRR